MASREAVLKWISILLVYRCIGVCFSLQFTAEPSDAVISPGDVAVLECQTSEINVTITWYKSTGDQISPNGGKYTQLTHGSLQIAYFASDDNGEYYCVAGNSAGSMRSRTAQLQVAYLEVVEMPPTEVQVAPKYSSTALTCTVPQSIPSAISSWYRGNEESGTLVESETKFGVTLSHELVFSCIGDTEQAPWNCYVSNQLYSDAEILKSSYLLMVNTGSLNTFQPIQLVQDALPVSQTVLVNNTVQFQCFAIGCPPPIFSWTKDGSAISASDHVFFSQMDRILTIKDAQLADAGNYTCLATQTGDPDMHRYSSAVLTVQEPLRVTSSFPTTSELASLSVNLTCTAEGPEPISWLWRHNTMELLETDDVQFDSSGNSSTLTISNLGVDGGGIVQCVAYDDQGGYASANELLTVKTIPVTFTHGGECCDVLAVVGMDIVLPCTATAYPPPSFSWTKTGTIVNVDSNSRITQSAQKFNGTLSISQLVLNDGGVYTCTAENVLGAKDSNAIIVTVIDEPQILAMPEDKIVMLGTTAFFNCEVESNVMIEYHWTKDGVLYAENQMSGTLTIANLQETDFGKYECMVTISAVGSNAPPIIIVVGSAFLSAVPPKPPSPPLGLVIANVTNESVQVLWSEPEDTGGLEIISYEFMIISLGRPDCELGTGSFNYSVIPSTDKLHTTIPSLSPYFRYQIAVSATNSKGTGNFSELSSIIWTDQAAPFGAPGEVLATQGEHVGELLISWQTPPCDKTNGIITNYMVEYSVFSSLDSQPVIFPTTTNMTSSLLTDLRPLEDYMVQVSAHTSEGTGPWSSPVVAQLTIADPPGPPTAVSAEIINYTAVRLEWQPPDPLPWPLHNLTAITQYVVGGSSGNVYVSKDTFTLDYTGLVGGASQTLSVAAINSFGVGKPHTVMVILPSPSASVEVAVPIYQELWFLSTVCGVVLVLGVVVLVATIVCIVVKKRTHINTGSKTAGGQSNCSSLSGYSARRETFLHQMITVEEVDSHHNVPNYMDLDQVRQEMNDASSVGTSQSQSSTLQLNSKYRYRSPLEQEIYASRGALTPGEAGDNSSLRSSQSELAKHTMLNPARPSWARSKTLTPPTVHHRLHRMPPSRNSSSPTDTVDSFEYQSQSQIIADMERLARSQHFRHNSRNGLHSSHSPMYDHIPSRGVPIELNLRVPPAGHPLEQKQSKVRTSLQHPPSSLPYGTQTSPAMHSNTISFPSQHKLHSERQRELGAAPESPPHLANPTAATTNHISQSPSQSSGIVSPSRVSMLSSLKSSQLSSPKKRQHNLALLTALPSSKKANARSQASVPVSGPVPPHLQVPRPLENGDTNVLPSNHLSDEGYMSEPSHCVANIHRQPTKLAEEEEKKAIMKRLQQKNRNRGYDQQALNMIHLPSAMNLPNSAGIPGKYTPTEATFV